MRVVGHDERSVACDGHAAVRAGATLAENALVTRLDVAPPLAPRRGPARVLPSAILIVVGIMPVRPAPVGAAGGSAAAGTGAAGVGGGTYAAAAPGPPPRRPV